MPLSSVWQTCCIHIRGFDEMGVKRFFIKRELMLTKKL